MTGNDIYGIAQDLAKVSGSQIAIPAYEESRALDWINWLRDQFFTETELYKRVSVYELPSATALSAPYSGASTMSLDSVTGFNGAFAIGDEIGFNTSTSALNLTGVSNVNVAYGIDEKVQPLIKLPDYIAIHNFKFDGTEVEQTILNTPTGKFVTSNGFSKLTVNYSYLPTALATLEDEVGIANPYHYYIVYGLLKIWKEVDESTQDTSLESARMNAIANQAVAKNMKGRKLNITSFSRYTL